MGKNYTYICRSCGRDKELIVGEYGCKGWDWKTKNEILEGKHGKDAKAAFTKNPKALYHFESGIFKCVCGYVGSYDSLVIHSRDPVDYDTYYITRHRCPWCSKTLEQIKFFPLDIPCRCGSMMEIDRKSLIRW